MPLRAAVFLLACLAGCGQRPGAADAGFVDSGTPDSGTGVCAALAPPDCTGPVPTYAELSPTFTQRCVTCHDGQVGGPWPLTTYQHLSDWQDAVRSEILNCTMPPLDAGAPITFEERRAIFTWVRCGRPK